MELLARILYTGRAMKNSRSGMIVCALCFWAACGFGAATYQGPELETLPDAVQKVIKEQTRDAKLVAIEENAEDNDAAFTVEYKKGDVERSFAVRADGVLVRVQVTLAELPEKARATAAKQVGNGAVARIDKYPSEDGASYDIEITKGGRDRAFTIDTDGELATVEMFLEETPAVVQKAIRNRLGTGRLGDIFKIIEDGEATYDVTMSRHRRSLEFSVSASGRLITSDMLLEELPAPVQKTVRAQVGEGRLSTITLFNDQGKTTYEVAFYKGDILHVIEVAADGKVIESHTPETVLDA